MRRFWILTLAALFLISSLAAAEPLAASGNGIQLPDSILAAIQEAQSPALDVAEPDPVEEQPTAEEFSLPDVQSIPGAILGSVLDLLDAQDFTLSLEDVNAGSQDTLVLHRLDEDQLEIRLTSSDDGGMRIVVGAESIALEVDGASTEYGYEELLYALLGELAYELDLEDLLMNVYADGSMQNPPDLLLSLIPSEEDEAFLMQAFEIAMDELAHAGLDFETLETYDGSYLHLEFSPKLLCNAAVRFGDRVLEYADEVDALLAHYDAPLRMLLPELFELSDSEQRTAPLSCTELKFIWQYVRQELLGQWTDDAGAALDLYADDYGTIRLNLQIRKLPDCDSAVLMLDIDEDGHASGTLTLMQRDYGYGVSNYGLVAQVFDIDLSVVDSGMMLRVTPRTPSEDFTLLTANMFFGYDGMAFDLTSDTLRLRLKADYEGLAGSLELADEFSADLNLSFGDFIHGSLILSEGWYSYVLRLNE